jgi:hypothetical protein
MGNLTLNQASPTVDPSSSAGAGSHRSMTSSQKQAHGQQDVQSFQQIGGTNDVNTVLLYNIAAMSYQTQQYGKALTYLNEILKNLEQAEDFL